MSFSSLSGASLAITGVDGFVGRHLAKIASIAGAEVVGIARSESPDTELQTYLNDYHSVDLRERWPAKVRPDLIIHLAGLASVGPSFTAPQHYINSNSAMVTNMCEAALAHGNVRRIIGVSTGALYASSDGRDAIVESDPVQCSSPYVVSKLLVENQFEYYRRRGLGTVVARPFNHFGPGQGEGFILPDLLNQLIASPVVHSIKAGNLSTGRDYTDVRDVCHAYLELATAESLNHTIYNVASGTSTTGDELLDLLCNQLDITRPEVISDSKLFRPTDASRVQGSPARLFEEVGWRPRITIQQTIRDTVEQFQHPSRSL